jgi:hypothetical protein
MVLGFVGPICDKYLNNIKISKSKKNQTKGFGPLFTKKHFMLGIPALWFTHLKRCTHGHCWGYQLTSITPHRHKQSTSCIYLMLYISLCHLTTSKSNKYRQSLYHQCHYPKKSQKPLDHHVFASSFFSTQFQLLLAPPALGP